MLKVVTYNPTEKIKEIKELDASQIDTKTANFNNNLSSADDTIQKALDTLDNVVIPDDVSDLNDANDNIGKVKVDSGDVLDYLENQIQGSMDGSVNVIKDISDPTNPVLVVSANPRIFAINADGIASNNLIDKLEAGDNITIEPSPNQPADGITSFKVKISATNSGGSSLPNSGTMLYYDGTNWVASGDKFGYEENNNLFWWGDRTEENPSIIMSMPDQYGNYSLRLGAGWYGDSIVFGLPVMYSDPSRQLEGDVYFNGNTKKIRYYDGTNWVDIDTSSGSLPSGSINQTLRHDGNDWVANNNVLHKAGGLIESTAWSGKANQDLIVNSNYEAVAERRIVSHVYTASNTNPEEYDTATSVDLQHQLQLDGSSFYQFELGFYAKHGSGSDTQRLKISQFSSDIIAYHNATLEKVIGADRIHSYNVISNQQYMNFANANYDFYRLTGVIETGSGSPAYINSFYISTGNTNTIYVKNYAYFKAIKETQ